MARSKSILAVAFVIALVALLRVSAHGSGYVFSGDFAANYTGASIVRDGRIESLYNVEVQRPLEHSLFERIPDGWFNLYILPPFAAYAFLPLALLPYELAAEIFFGLSILLFMLSTKLLWSLLPTLQTHVRLSTVVLIALVSAPSWYLLMTGQNTALVMMLLVSGLVLLVRERDVPAGILFGLGMFKPQLFVLIPVVLVLHRRWKALSAWAGTAAALGLLSFLLVGIDGMRAYLHLFSSDDYVADIASARAWRMISLVSQVRYLGSGIIDVPVNVAWALSVLPLVLAPLILWKVRGNLPQTFALAVLLMMVFNPHIYYYDLLLLLIPALILLNARPDTRLVHGALLATFVLSWAMEPLHWQFGDQGWPLILLSTHWLPIPILVLTFALIREMRAKTSNVPVPSAGAAPEIGLGSLAAHQ